MAKRRERKKAAAGDTAATVGFEAQLWQAADALRGRMDAAEYKHVVLGLIFLKYISDAFEEPAGPARPGRAGAAADRPRLRGGDGRARRSSGRRSSRHGGPSWRRSSGRGSALPSSRGTWWSTSSGAWRPWTARPWSSA
jgi:hypothetical protein